MRNINAAPSDSTPLGPMTEDYKLVGWSWEPRRPQPTYREESAERTRKRQRAQNLEQRIYRTSHYGHQAASGLQREITRQAKEVAKGNRIIDQVNRSLDSIEDKRNPAHQGFLGHAAVRATLGKAVDYVVVSHGAYERWVGRRNAPKTASEGQAQSSGDMQPGVMIAPAYDAHPGQAHAVPADSSSGTGSGKSNDNMPISV